MAKRFLKTTVVSVIFALTLAVSASAATAGGATTTTAVNFRTGAGTNYGIISTLPAGTHVVVSERSSGNWATVVYNGTVGYISSDYLKRANDMDASFGTGTICGSYVRMRSSASTSSSILGTYNSGTTMTVTGVSGAWYKVDYNGTDGYVYSNYLSLSGVTSSGGSASGSNGSVKGSDVRMRSGPGTNYSILGTYQNGTALTVTGTENGWSKVTIGGTAVTDAAITYNDNGFVASINMMNYQKQIDAPVVITYTATVNENAIQRDKETNTATLKYSNDPADKNSFKESSVEVNVFSFNIVINKYAAGNENTKLAGAKFVLKNNEGKYYKYDAAKVTWVDAKADATEVITGADGAARFDGLQAGTYYLEETAAPAGYNQLTKDITIVLNKDGSATIDSASSTLGADHSLTAGVANSTGTMLPETGGIGTVIFVALGALAVICAGVFLVTNKRMSKESF